MICEFTAAINLCRWFEDFWQIVVCSSLVFLGEEQAMKRRGIWPGLLILYVRVEVVVEGSESSKKLVFMV